MSLAPPDILQDRRLRAALPEIAFGYLDALRAAPADAESFLHFLGFATRHAARARGQLFQDLWALWESGERRGGYFVEFGAGDGLRFSNTWLLETAYGWDGVLADPNPAFAAALRANRGCRVSTDCVWARTGETLAFLPAGMGELSRLRDVVPDDMIERAGLRGLDPAGEVAVPTVSLDDLLRRVDAPREIDFMSVDTEGSELAILTAFPFARWRIRTICVEHNWTGARDALHALLTGHGYRRKWEDLTRQDDWYVLEG